MSQPLPLSLIVITRDAAHELAECLASAPFAAEAVVVDSGSRDDTVAIAQRAGARVVDHAFEGYGPQKNFAVAQAGNDWVLCIDVLEHIEPAYLETVLLDLGGITKRFGFFSIATGPAGKTLPDGRNAHLIQKPSSWWLPRLCEHFEIIQLGRDPHGFWVITEPRKQ